jgi:GNAT superfamily N-acetyltransferase
MTTRQGLRPATTDDVPAIARIAAASDEPIETPGVPGSPYAEHLLARGTVVVAETDGVVVGYTAAVPIGTWRHVTDLFVHPAARGHGWGRALLASILAGAPAATTFASDDPRALPVYVRAGLRALWPNLYLEGRAVRLVDPGLVVRPVAAAEAAATERAFGGIDRSADHAYWGTRRDAVPFLVLDGDTPVGAGCAVHRRGRPGRWLPHLAIAPAADAVAVAVAAVHATAAGGPASHAGAGTDARGSSAHATSVCVPGPHPALPALLDAGFKVVDRDIFLATSPAFVDPERLLPDPSLL